MALLPLLLVLSAAVAHASWNIIAHRTTQSGPLFLWWGSVVGVVVWGCAIPFTGGWGTPDIAGIFIGAAISAVLHVAYFILLQRGYAAGDLSTVYALARGTGPLITVIAAVTLLGERLSLLATIGVVAVVTGIVAMGLVDRAKGATTPTSNRGVIFGLLTGVAIAAYTVWDTFALREWSTSPVAYMVGCSALEVVILSAVFVRGKHTQLIAVWRLQWRQIILFGVIAPLSYVLVLTAITIAPVALVAPIREVSVMLVSLFGVFVLREGNPVRRVLASAVVVGGVVMMAM